MKAWHRSPLLVVGIMCWYLHTATSTSPVAGCCGPAPGDCSCRMLEEEEIPCYYSKFAESEPTYLTPQFTTYPQSGTFPNGVKVTLSCSVSYTSSPTSCPLPLTWEHNGTVVTSSSGLHQTDVIDADVYHSTLTIPQFSASYQGDYVCRVGGETTSDSITSPPAYLQLPKFLGWVDRAYPGPTHGDSVSLTVQKGGSVILECSPNTTESLEGMAPRVEARTPTLSLPSGSLLLQDVQEDTNVSCVWPLQEAQTRHFTISVYADPTPGDLRLVVRPADTVVSSGSSVELYCVAEGPRPTSLLWLRDGLLVNDEEHVLIVGGGQVLEIRGATDAHEGTYMCVVSDGSQSVNASAVVTVVDPPGVVSLTVDPNISGLSLNDETRIISLSPYFNSSLSLSCHVDTTTTPLHYQWLHGGVVIAEGDDTLVLTGADLHTMTGSYQCTVSNTAGRQSSLALRIDEAKPSPPVDVAVARNTATGVYFQYDIKWIKPEEGFHVTNYTVETLAMKDDKAAQFCSCVDKNSEWTNTMFAFHAGCPGFSLSRDYTLFYRVAANTMDSQSAFVSGDYTTVSIGSPPSAGDLSVVEREASGDKWELSLNWVYRHTDNYKKGCYDTTITPPCSSTDMPVATLPVKASMNCCTTCEWAVTNINRAYPNRTTTTSSNYPAPAIRPLAPPQLISVERIGTNGTDFFISFQLPDDSMACMCGVRGLYINVTVRTNDTAIDLVSRSVSLTDSKFKVHIPGAVCSSAYDISLAFHNSVGMSGFSTPYSIGLPTGGNIPLFSSQQPLQYQNVSSSEVAVSYQLDPGAGCMLSNNLLHSNICYAELAPSQDKCSPAVLATLGATCTDINSEQGKLLLPRYHKFCVVATIWSDILDVNISSVHLIIPANEDKPSSEPQGLTLTPGTNDSLDMSWTALPADSWNGVPYRYSVNVSVGRVVVNSTTYTVLAQPHSLVYEDYNSSLPYIVSVSACTRVGCGPGATKTITEQTKEEPSTTSDDFQSVTDEPSTGSGSVLLIAAVSSGAFVLLLVLVILLVAVVVCCVCCPTRKRKGYGRLRSESTADFRTALLDGDETLVGSREPPTGVVARSEYTEIESLYSGDSRVVDWVKQTTSLHRDSYVRDADEELAVLQEERSNGPPLAPPTAPSTQTHSGNGYISESRGSSPQDNPTSSPSRSSGSTRTTSTAPLSSGYSTEQDLTQIQTNPPATQHNNPQHFQAAYTGIHNLSLAQPSSTATVGYQSPVNTPPDQTHGDFTRTTDFLSSLLCEEDFNPPSTSSVVGHKLVNTTHRFPEPHITPASPYTPNSPFLTPSPSTSPPLAGNSSQSATDREEEETDSVFDTSLSPIRHSGTCHIPPGRTRSSMTSGFLSLSETSLDSNDHMEMTSIHQQCHAQPLPLGPSPWTPPTQSAAPVIPSLLCSKPVAPFIPHSSMESTQLVMPPPALETQLSCYENVDSNPLAHADVRFEL